MDHPRFVIVGGGLAGALTACYLGKAGYEVDVYEMRDDLRVAEVGGGRSINLALSFRGLCALEPVGLTDEVLRQAVPMRGRMIHSAAGEAGLYRAERGGATGSNRAMPGGKVGLNRAAFGGGLDFQSYGVSESQAINSVSRGGLNGILLSAAENYPSVRLHFDHKCVDVDLDRGEVEFLDTRLDTTKKVRGDVIVSADGAFSAVRRAMQKRERFNYRQDYLEHGYKELSIPPGTGGSFQLESNALHIWPRQSFMMIALPNADGSFTVTLFWPFAGPNGFDAIRTEADLYAFFEAQFPDALPLMPTLAEDYFGNPTGSLVTIRCSPWHVEDRVVLLGDAAHAVVPFYGQGMNAAFEDVLVLDECLKAHMPDRRRAFEAFEAARKPNADALADLALENFVEMRDHTGSKVFLMKKKGEKLLAKLLPSLYLPLYSMVTFSRIPYAHAVQRARRQNRIIAGVATIVAFSLILLMIAWLR